MAASCTFLGLWLNMRYLDWFPVCAVVFDHVLSPSSTLVPEPATVKYYNVIFARADEEGSQLLPMLQKIPWQLNNMWESLGPIKGETRAYELVL